MWNCLLGSFEPDRFFYFFIYIFYSYKCEKSLLYSQISLFYAFFQNLKQNPNPILILHASLPRLSHSLSLGRLSVLLDSVTFSFARLSDATLSLELLDAFLSRSHPSLDSFLPLLLCFWPIMIAITSYRGKYLMLYFFCCSSYTIVDCGCV